MLKSPLKSARPGSELQCFMLTKKLTQIALIAEVANEKSSLVLNSKFGSSGDFSNVTHKQNRNDKKKTIAPRERSLKVANKHEKV